MCGDPARDRTFAPAFGGNASLRYEYAGMPVGKRTYHMDFSDEQLEKLRDAVRTRLDDYRFRHTLGVERCAARLAAQYLPEDISLMRAAALLHDVTKCLGPADQLNLCRKYDILLEPIYEQVPQSLHAITAAALIPYEFPEFADPVLIDAVRYHTTGREVMTVPDKLLYLADYIEPGRTFPDCMRVRDYYDSQSRNDPEEHLLKTLLLSFDLTIGQLITEGGVILPDTVYARNACAVAIRKKG